MPRASAPASPAGGRRTHGCSARHRRRCKPRLTCLPGELAFIGLQEEEQQFLYMAARLRLPSMEDAQFIEVMNIIVSKEETEAKLASIDRMARNQGGPPHG